MRTSYTKKAYSRSFYAPAVKSFLSKGRFERKRTLFSFLRTRIDLFAVLIDDGYLAFGVPVCIIGVVIRRGDIVEVNVENESLCGRQAQERALVDDGRFRNVKTGFAFGRVLELDVFEIDATGKHILSDKRNVALKLNVFQICAALERVVRSSVRNSIRTRISSEEFHRRRNNYAFERNTVFKAMLTDVRYTLTQRNVLDTGTRESVLTDNLNG